MNNTQAGTNTSWDQHISTALSGISTTPSQRTFGNSLIHLSRPERPMRVYRIVLSRGVQEVTCTSVATDEGFLKFYNTMTINNQIHTSVVAMYPSVNVQQVTSVLEADQVIV